MMMKQKFYCVLVVAALLCSMATFVKAELPVKTTWEASDTTAVLQDGKFAFAPLDLTNATPFKGSASGDTFSTNP